MLSLFSLNVRGIRQSIKRKALFLFAKQLKPDFCFFQESHSTVNDIKFWRSQWGNDLWFSHGTERSAGVTTLRNAFKGNILHSDSDSNGHFLCNIIDIDSRIVIIANIYGFNVKTENISFLDYIISRIQYWLKKFPSSIIVIGGDFNISIDSALDKWPPGRPSLLNSKIKQFMERLDLFDVWRSKFPNTKAFTWSNKAASQFSRLDFWLISNSLNSQNTTVDILPTPLTDHKAIYIKIIISINPLNTTRISYWKLNSSHLCHNTVRLKINFLIRYYWKKALSEHSFINNWELLKFDIGKFMRR